MKLFGRAATALFAGLALTILVAWALAAAPAIDSGSFAYGRRHIGSSHEVSVYRSTFFGQDFVQVHLSATDIPGIDLFGVLCAPDDRRPIDALTGDLPDAAHPEPLRNDGASIQSGHSAWNVVLLSGWPFRSFWCELDSGSWPPNLDTTTVRHGIEIPLTSRTIPPTSTGSPLNNDKYPVVLPYAPVWPGLALNTAFYGAIVCVPAFIRRLHRRARARRGCCPQCNYNLLGDLRAGCPECGWNKQTNDRAALEPITTPDPPSSPPSEGAA